ncbi:hypothetical protein SK3146_05709 [Paenibacillus konkukensis]|uniref:DUF5704 domain-containing protein n=1 Tax=Paenibacillus konkukensis TaxID=2020716 RepID=A0ABY4RUX6_9BACL|nr:DUF5704 domain-containing protein [Paenibacillus konkukensis]UQZ86416.1 hypothetical protein SK3146_05709 [Paenibacillus konkukensis]
MKLSKLHKPILYMLLACTFFMSFMPQQAVAASPEINIKDGAIQFEITSTAATTSIRYKTVGWVVTREQVCSAAVPKQCSDPRDRPHALFLNQEVRQKGQYPDPPIPGQPLTSYYEVPEEIVTQRLWAAGMDGIQDNDDLYFYAVMVSINGDGSVRKGPFYTLSGIKQAEGWRVPDDLDDYFGLHIPYRSAEFPVDVVAKTVDGRIIQKPDVTFLKGKYKIGETIDHEFPATLTDGGKTYRIVRSYLSPKQDTTQKKWLQENPETNEKVRIRSFTVALGGSDAIAEFEEAASPVKAYYQKEDGTVLQEVDKGEFATGAEVNHTFEATITKGGQTYEIIRSFITSNSNPTEKLFIQEKGDSKLRERSILVGPSGSNFVGIYKVPSPVTVTSRIDAPGQAASTETAVTGDFTFEAKSQSQLKSYRITSIENGQLVNASQQTGALSGTSASKSLPIRIPLGSSDQVTVKITVVVTDMANQTGDSTADHTVQNNRGGEPPQTGSEQQHEDMDASASAVIKADTRGAERYDVLKGIPTSESLYVNASAKAYLYKNKFTELKGTKQYPVTVSRTYSLQWTEYVSGPPDSGGNPTTIPVSRSATQTVTQNYTVERKFSYWLIDRLEVYGLQRAEISNYALPGGKVTLQPSGYTPPTVSASHDASPSAHVTDPVYRNVTLPGQSLYGGSSRPAVPSENWKNEAEKAVGKIKVRNDSLVFNGQTIMDSRTTEETAPAPGAIPASPMIGQNVLYGSGFVIDSGKINKAAQPSSGTLSYALIKGIGGGSNQSFPISGINPVTVHTPVVSRATVSDDQAHNQKTVPTPGRSALILNRPFTVTIPTSGLHRDITGYGNRDYAKYTRDKQVRFPFDVYKADRTTLIPKETWTSIPVGQLQTTFYLPVWVDEGNYEVLFRSFAENSPSSFTSQPNANLDVNHHAATQVVPVEVIGRLFDFRITDIADYQWETVFRTAKGSATPNGNSYWVGPNGIDGAARGNKAPYMLPIRPGSHPESGKKNVAIKTGYHFKFEVKTLGNMFGSGDGILITPTFYFVDKKGQNRQPVDLYYHAGNKRFIRIGSAEDTEQRLVTLDTRLRNVPQQELTNTASSLWRLNGATGNQATYVQQFLKDAVQKKIVVGGYDGMLLPPQLRTFIGSMQVPSGVDAVRANAAVQLWRGEYSLPAAPYAVPAGFNVAEYGRTHRLDDQSPIFLRDGYLIVNFNIETVRNRNTSQPHLQYKNAPLNNQWRMEGFGRSFVDPYGASFSLLDGDVVFYHADLSSYDDFGTGGTH